MKIFYTFLISIVALVANAQAPQGFNYQATVRNNSGALMTNASVQLKFSILQDTATGTVVYSESQTKTTDGLGQVSTVVGQGTALTGTFAAINWGTGTHFLAIELNTGNGFVAMGTTQLLSVPYALYANKSAETAALQNQINTLQNLITALTSNSSNPGSFTHYVGELFGGGIVVSVWKDAQGVENGLIASLSDLSAGIPWTTPAFQNDQIQIGPSAQSSKDGLANTNAIVAQAGEGSTYAAGICKAYNAGGFTDWYLPAIDELKLLYFSQHIIYGKLLGESNGLQSLFSNSNYWSSTETKQFLWADEGLVRIEYGVFSLYLGDTQYENKANGGYAVRAVRRF